MVVVVDATVASVAYGTFPPSSGQSDLSFDCSDGNRLSKDGVEYLSLLTTSDAVPASAQLLALVTCALEAAVERNELSAQLKGAETAPVKLTVFHGLRPPPITIDAYVERISKYAKCSPVCFVMALSYMSRLAQMDVCYQATTLNVHRLLLANVLVATKFTDDRYFNNAFFAKVGGISTTELNCLEREVLRMLEYRLYVSPEAVQQMLKQLQMGMVMLENCTESLRMQTGGRKRRTCGEDVVVSDERRLHRRSCEMVVEMAMC